MGTTLILKDGKREFIGRDGHFTDVVREYMGNDAAQWFDDRIEEANAIVQEAKDASQEKRHEIENYVLRRLIPAMMSAKHGECDDLEDLAEDFKAEMEDVYGLDE